MTKAELHEIEKELDNILDTLIINGVETIPKQDVIDILCKHKKDYCITQIERYEEIKKLLKEASHNAPPTDKDKDPNEIERVWILSAINDVNQAIKLVR